MRRSILAAVVLALTASGALAQEAPKPLDNPCLIKEVLLDFYRTLHDPSARTKWGAISMGAFDDRIKTLNGVSCDHIPELVAGLGENLSLEEKSFFLEEAGIEISLSCDPDTNRIRWAFIRPKKES